MHMCVVSLYYVSAVSFEVRRIKKIYKNKVKSKENLMI